ncbi:microsomal signal peptidase 25 kDa subunit-domain-containing protein [Coniochaeta sp. 2T2.1]|nr:microsomal signal peptidase 25 kDa subunit-domain-containing protein [Coniochaeta sp. 2T2.1]
MASQEKITVYNLADLKNTSDDTIPVYLNSLKFVQSHTLTDVRLALGYSALAIAAACFAWDYKLGFDDTKYYTAAAVAVYTVLNTALTLWIWKREKGVVYVGTAPSGETVTIATSTTKHDPTYHLTITISPKSGTPQTTTISRPFNTWFDSAGHFVPAPFQTMLATAIPAVGKLDPKRLSQPAAQATPEEKTETQAATGTESRYTAEMLDAISSEMASGNDAAAATPGTGGKKGKRRGKA